MTEKLLQDLFERKLYSSIIKSRPHTHYKCCHSEWQVDCEKLEAFCLDRCGFALTLNALPSLTTFELYKDEFEKHIREQLLPCKCVDCSHDILHSSANDIGVIFFMSAGNYAQEDATIMNQTFLSKGMSIK